MSNIFLGLPIPATISESLLAVIFAKHSHWRDHSDLRWTHVGDHHLTLHFFGAMPMEILAPFIAHLGNYLQNFKKFQLKINKIGCFPNVDSKILAAFVNLLLEVENLYQKIQQAVADHEFPRQARSYLPHITLCRARKRGILTMEEHFFEDFTVTVTELILYQTQSTSTGSHYLPIQTWFLK